MGGAKRRRARPDCGSLRAPLATTTARPRATRESPPTATPAPPGFWRLNGINAFWFVNRGMWSAIYILLAISAALLAPSQKELVVGRATAAGGVLAVLVPVLAGVLSDRTVGRWGRRTPRIVGGTVINLAGLCLLAWAPSVGALVVAYLVLQLGNNTASAAFAGIIPTWSRRSSAVSPPGC